MRTQPRMYRIGYPGQPACTTQLRLNRRHHFRRAVSA